MFNQISRTNETRYVSWHEICKCKCRLDAGVCNNKQRWNNDKYRCGCKELIDKGRCDKGFIWNPSKWECKCDKSCDVGQYLGYESCKCRTKLIGRLVEECSDNIDGNELIYNATSMIVEKYAILVQYIIVLLVIFFIISTGISCAFVYFHRYLKKSITNITDINKKN